MVEIQWKLKKVEKSIGQVLAVNKASMILIIGEYAERINNPDELLGSFPEEPALVQLQLLTATVKLFLKKPTEGPQQMIQVVLNNSTVETDNPDLRDRAYIYWHLLSTDPEAAQDVVLAEKPIIKRILSECYTDKFNGRPIKIYEEQYRPSKTHKAALALAAPVPDLLGDLIGLGNALVTVDQSSVPSGIICSFACFTTDINRPRSTN